VSSQTLLGSVPTDGVASSVVLNGNLAYVANSQDIAVVNISDPTNPQVVTTFGSSDLNLGGTNFVQLDGNNLVVASENTASNGSSFNLLVYSLANPSSPQLLSNTTIPYAFATDLFVQGNTAFIPIAGTSKGNGNLTGQTGDFLAVDLSNPAAPKLTGVLFNNRGQPQGSDNNEWAAVPINSQVVYVAGTTSTGADTQTGTGRVLIVNTANPAGMSVAGTLDIPGTVQALAIAVHGNQALVVGSTGGWQTPYDATSFGLTGNLTLTLLDISNPLAPTVIGSTVVTQDTFNDLGDITADNLRAVYLGNDQYAVSDTQTGGLPVLLMVNASDPNNLVTSTVAAPAFVNGMTVSGNLLLATSSAGLGVYQIPALTSQSVTASVIVPTTGAAAVVPNSFSVQPNQIIPGNGTETLEWNLTLAPGAGSQQITWETTLTGLAAGQVVAVATGATIQDGSQQYTLPASNVAGIPETQTITIPVQVVAPGVPAIANAAVAAAQAGNTNLANQLQNLGTALTSLVQSPTSAVFQSQAVAAIASLVSQVIHDPFLASFAPGLTAGSTAIANATTAAEVQTAVINLGNTLAALAQAITDAAAHGFTLSLVGPDAVIQPNAATVYTLQMQNTGTSTTTYDFGVSGLPAGATATFSQPSLTLTPGATIPSGTNTVTLSLSEPGVTTLIPADFTVTATAERATEITAGTPGQLDLRPESLGVGAVSTNPPFTDAGGQVDVTAKIESVVNEPRQVSVSYTVTDVNGNVLFTDPSPVSEALGVTSTLTTVDLGTFDTTGFANGADTIIVTVTDQSSQPLPSAAGVGSVTVGSPVTATLTTGPATLPAGAGTVTSTLDLTSSVPLPAPLTVDGSVATTPATAVALYQDTLDNLGLAYVSGPNGIDVVDVSNPAAPVDKGTFGQSDIVNGGLTIARVDTIGGQDYLLVGTTAENNANQFKLLVYSLANPLSPSLVSTTLIPYQFMSEMLVAGNTVLVPTEGYQFVFGSFADQFGTVLAIDVSNPSAPVLAGLVYHDRPAPDGGDTTQYGGVIVNNQLLGTTLATDAAFGITSTLGKVSALPLGNGLFAVSNGAVNGNPELLVVDPSDPNNIVVTYTPVPAVDNEMAASGDLLYATSAQGLTIYQIGQVESVPVTVSVQVPHGSVVSGSLAQSGAFSSTAPQLVPGTNSDTITWTGMLAYGASDVTLTWQSTVSNLGVGQVVPVTTGGSVTFVSQGTAGAVSLAGTAVTGVSFLSLSPLSQTAPPGGTASYDVQLSNPTDAAVTYYLLVDNSASGYQFTYTLDGSSSNNLFPVAPGATVDVLLQATPRQSAAAGDEAFKVEAYDAFHNHGDGAFQTTPGDLVVAGTPVPPADPVAHGVVVALTPAQATAGQGDTVSYVVQVTNTGSADDRYRLQVNGLPFGVYANFDQTYQTNGDIDVPPGAGNFRDITITVATFPGLTPGDYPFTVTATSLTDSSETGTTNGTLTVAANGVSVSLDKTSGAPGDTFQMTVTNTGTVTDTFDLALAGPAALVASLGMQKVTLDPGASQQVAITTQAVTFAVSGNLPLMATATSEGNPAVQAGAAANLVIGNTTGLTASASPSVQVLPVPGTTSFLVLVNNTGNLQDSYTATITGTTGPVTAALMGLDGQPTQTIPTFILPGLSTGALLLQTDLSATGPGKVNVQVQSLNDPSRTATVTATVSAATPGTSPVTPPPPTPTPAPAPAPVVVVAPPETGVTAVAYPAIVQPSPVLEDIGLVFSDPVVQQHFELIFWGDGHFNLYDLGVGDSGVFHFQHRYSRHAKIKNVVVHVYLFDAQSFLGALLALAPTTGHKQATGTDPAPDRVLS
jgi:uncharacterized membrane protein